MKYRLTIASLMFVNLVLLVLFQNCTNKDNSLSYDSNFSNGLLTEPVVYVTANSPCNNQTQNGQFIYGTPIAICIENAGNNPHYCIKNNLTQAENCGTLTGQSGWSYNGSLNERWSKTYQLSPSNPSLYFARGQYSITVRDTLNSTSVGQAHFVVF